jgi:hypothetical protein
MEIRPNLHRRIKEALEAYLLNDEIVYDQLVSFGFVFERYDSLLFTNKRVIHVKKSFSLIDFDDYSFESSSMVLEYGLIFDQIVLYVRTAEAFRMTLFSLDRARTLDFIKQVEGYATYRDSPGEKKEKQDKDEECDFKQKLKDLAELKKNGIITEEEFEKKKSEILKDI